VAQHHSVCANATQGCKGWVCHRCMTAVMPHEQDDPTSRPSPNTHPYAVQLHVDPTCGGLTSQEEYTRPIAPIRAGRVASVEKR